MQIWSNTFTIYCDFLSWWPRSRLSHKGGIYRLEKGIGSEVDEVNLPLFLLSPNKRLIAKLSFMAFTSYYENLLNISLLQYFTLISFCNRPCCHRTQRTACVRLFLQCLEDGALYRMFIQNYCPLISRHNSPVKVHRKFI